MEDSADVSSRPVPFEFHSGTHQFPVRTPGRVPPLLPPRLLAGSHRPSRHGNPTGARDGTHRAQAGRVVTTGGVRGPRLLGRDRHVGAEEEEGRVGVCVETEVGPSTSMSPARARVLLGPETSYPLPPPRRSKLFLLKSVSGVDPAQG